MLRDFANTAPALIAYIDQTLTYRYANETYRLWRGMAPDEVVGKSMREIVGERSYAMLEAKARAALGGEPVTYEMELFDGDRRRFVHGNYTPDRAADGSIAGFHVLVTDISDRRALEDRLIRSERQFNDAFRHAAIGMALVALDGSWCDVNPALIAMLGFGEQEFLALTFQDITHPDDLAADLDLLDDLVAGNIRSYQLEKRYFRKDGATVHAILAVSLVRDEHGAPLHFISQIQDITARRQAEELLFNEHELSQVTLRSIGDGVMTADQAARIAWLNPAAERLTGRSSTEVKGLPAAEVFQIETEDGAPVPDPLARAIGTGEAQFIDTIVMLKRADGSRIPVSDSAAPIRNQAGAIIGGVLVFQDASAERARRIQLLAQARNDALTGLLNRAGFDERLAAMMVRASADRQELALLFCDLDGFKPINDTYGHSTGDQVLKEVAARLLRGTRHGDVVARWAGDEFVIIIRFGAEETPDIIADRLTRSVHEPILVPGLAEPIVVGMSIGISIASAVGWDTGALLNKADAALYAAKARGGNAATFG
ncbi:diguanylate cyclase (GGDEF)-like protein/PAS domain S-box-containing protein [Sphingomonas zeicaulis]|uniref:GGDEF and EAL domain-containing protein n=1 Tax=Sphingomonas zeicaulis TaxID=1632740 RepID=UPI003D2168C4